MHHATRIVALVALVVIGSFAAGARAQDATTFNVDPEHSFVVFRVSHLGAGMTYGRFNDPTGTITVGEDGNPASLDIQVKADDIDTDNDRRDQHLRSPDFFNARQFPLITFKSTEIQPGEEDGTYQVTGDLSLHGVTKPVTLTLNKTGEVDNQQAGHRVGYETEFTVNRQDYGISFMPGGVGDEVTLMVALEAIEPR